MKNNHEFYVLSARFDGRGKGFRVGFSNEVAAFAFRDYILLGFGQVVTWYEFESKYPNYQSN